MSVRSVIEIQKLDEVAHFDAKSFLPGIVRQAGPKAEEKFAEFFAASIRNVNTRMAYLKAVRKFFAWPGIKRLRLEHIRSLHVAAYIEALGKEFSAPTAKQNLAAIRMLFDYLVVGQVVEMNPAAAAVKGPSYSAKKGKTPVLDAEEARQLLDRIDTSSVVGLRDRAIIGLMVYTFARVGAPVAMNVEDYFAQGKRWWIRLHEKGGKLHDVPALGWIRRLVRRNEMSDTLTQVDERLSRIEAALISLVQEKASKEWYSTAEVAEIVSKAEYTVREWCRQGRIHASKKAYSRGAHPSAGSGAAGATGPVPRGGDRRRRRRSAGRPATGGGRRAADDAHRP
jgi:integrase